MENEDTRIMLDPPQSMSDRIRDIVIKNPCNEQVMGEFQMSSGGFLVPEGVVAVFREELNKWQYRKGLEGQWIDDDDILTEENNMKHEWIRSDEDQMVNVDNVESFGYELEELTEELTLADVWVVSIKVFMSSGAAHVITDLEEVIKFVRSLQSNTGNTAWEAKSGTLAYYVYNANRHENMVKEAQKLSGD